MRSAVNICTLGGLLLVNSMSFQGLHETLQKLFSSEQRMEQFKLDSEKKEIAIKQMYERQLKIEADLKESARMDHQSES